MREAQARTAPHSIGGEGNIKSNMRGRRQRTSGRTVEVKFSPVAKIEKEEGGERHWLNKLTPFGTTFYYRNESKGLVLLV
jgi:hypothetical protein